MAVHCLICMYDFIATYNDVITEKLNEILKEEGIV